MTGNTTYFAAGSSEDLWLLVVAAFSHMALIAIVACAASKRRGERVVINSLRSHPVDKNESKSGCVLHSYDMTGQCMACGEISAPMREAHEADKRADAAAGRDRCPSCRVLWHQHPGIQATCGELMEAQEKIEQLNAVCESHEKVMAGHVETYNALTTQLEEARRERDEAKANELSEWDQWQDERSRRLKAQSRLSLALAALREARATIADYIYPRENDSPTIQKIDKAIAEIEKEEKANG